MKTPPPRANQTDALIPYTRHYRSQESVSRGLTTAPITVIAGGAIFAARASAAIRSSVEVTVAWVVLVPDWVIATGVLAARPSVISDLAISPIEPPAARSTSVRLSAYRLQSTLSPQVTTETPRLFFVASGTPPYAPTPVPEEPTGRIPTPTPA